MSNLVNPAILTIANAQFNLEKKLAQSVGDGMANRQVARIKNALESLGLHIQDPQGEVYNETRTDLEASIDGPSTENLRVVSVIKPIIFFKEEQKLLLVQRGVVIVSAV